MSARGGIRRSACLGCALACLALASPVATQVASGGSFTLDRVRIAAGGGDANGAPYSATVTTGQPEAQAPASGGTFELRGGFHTGVAQRPDVLFRNGFEN